MIQDACKRCRQYDLTPQFRSPSQNFAFRTIKKVCNVGFGIVKKIFSNQDENKPQVYDWNQVQKVIKTEQRGFYPKPLWQIEYEKKQQQMKNKQKKKLTIFEIKEKLVKKKAEKPTTIKFRATNLQDLQKTMLTTLQNYQKLRYKEEIKQIKLNVTPVPMEPKYIGVSLFEYYNKKRNTKSNTIASPTIFNLNSQSFRKQVNQPQKQRENTVEVQNTSVGPTTNNTSSNNSSSDSLQFSPESSQQISRQPIISNNQNLKTSNQIQKDIKKSNIEQVSTVQKNMQQIRQIKDQKDSLKTKKDLGNSQKSQKKTIYQFQKPISDINNIKQVHKTEQVQQTNFSNNESDSKRAKNPFLVSTNTDQALQKIKNLNKTHMQNDINPHIFNPSQNMFSNPSPFNSFAVQNNSNNSSSNMFSLLRNSPKPQQKQNQNPYSNNSNQNNFISPDKSGRNLPLNMFGSNNGKTENSHSPNQNNYPFSTFQNNTQGTFNGMFSDKNSIHRNNNNQLQTSQSNFFNLSQNPKMQETLNSFLKSTDKSKSNDNSIFGNSNDQSQKRTMSKRRIHRDKSQRV